MALAGLSLETGTIRGLGRRRWIKTSSKVVRDIYYDGDFLKQLYDSRNQPLNHTWCLPDSSDTKVEIHRKERIWAVKPAPSTQPSVGHCLFPGVPSTALCFPRPSEGSHPKEPSSFMTPNKVKPQPESAQSNSRKASLPHRAAANCQLPRQLSITSIIRDVLRLEN